MRYGGEQGSYYRGGWAADRRHGRGSIVYASGASYTGDWVQDVKEGLGRMVWPARREVILRTTDHREVLDAINDRGITRLAVPDRPMRDVVHRPKEEDAAFDRVASAFV